TEYKKEFALPAAFPPIALYRILADVWSERGIANLRVAETEKYAHVTYFFNGGVERAFPGEERVLLPSWRGATYDLHPEMSAAAIQDEGVRGPRPRPPGKAPPRSHGGGRPGARLPPLSRSRRQLRERGHGGTHRKAAGD